MPTKTRSTAKKPLSKNGQANRDPSDSVSLKGQRRWLRHVGAAALSVSLVGIFWSTRSNWVDEMRLWKAVGDAAYVLLLFTLALGPIAKLVPSARKWLPDDEDLSSLNF